MPTINEEYEEMVRKQRQDDELKMVRYLNENYREKDSKVTDTILKDYGAAGDGVADDTAPVQRAMTVKLCKDCVHYVPINGHFVVRPSDCRAPKNTRINLVHGGTEAIFNSAGELRAYSHLCGEAGAWFTPREGA